MPPVPRPQGVVTAWDFFVYALMFGTLIFGANNLLVLFHFLIDWWLDVGFNPWRISSARWVIAVLFVAVPVYGWLTLGERKSLPVIGVSIGLLFANG